MIEWDLIAIFIKWNFICKNTGYVPALNWLFWVASIQSSYFLKGGMFPIWKYYQPLSFSQTIQFVLESFYAQHSMPNWLFIAEFRDVTNKFCSCNQTLFTHNDIKTCESTIFVAIQSTSTGEMKEQGCCSQTASKIHEINLVRPFNTSPFLYLNQRVRNIYDTRPLPFIFDKFSTNGL